MSSLPATGREALETVQNGTPDLIILDLMLPDVDGMEVCRSVRAQETAPDEFPSLC